MDKIGNNIKSAEECVQKADTIHGLLHELKPKYFGGGSLLEELSNLVRSGSLEEKKVIGPQIKNLKEQLENIFSTRLAQLEQIEIDAKLSQAAIDASASISYTPKGSRHPLSLAIKRMISIFQKYGCSVLEDSEIGSVLENFEMLNVVADHPARQMHDTFYLNGTEQRTGEHYLLRTHATGADVKALKEKGAPIRSIAFGKVFRRDLDSTHSPMFHQLDLLMVDKNLNLGSLKFILTEFLKEYFETNEIELRTRPSFFPFTEPSLEIDIQYSIRDGRIIPDKKGTRYMEILGCGILRPIVLQNCNIDPEVYTAIAAGIGVERLVMLKHGFKDIRDFYKSDVNWLEEAENKVVFKGTE